MTRRDFLLLPIGLTLVQETKGDLLSSGFNDLYYLRFSEARAKFLSWQREYLEDPMGFAAEAASHLFEEFEHGGVLTVEFFLEDDRLLGGIEGNPDAARTAAFEKANEKARVLSDNRLKTNPRDANALLARTLSAGMKADYLGIIAKRQFDSLSQIRSAESFGKRLLEVAPEMGDGYVALGAASYIIGSLPFYKRAFLWFGGVKGDKERGLDQLRQASSTGRYLAPYAKVMLSLALLREKQPAESLALMRELAAEFPRSPLFARELVKIQLAQKK